MPTVESESLQTNETPHELISKSSDFFHSLGEGALRMMKSEQDLKTTEDLILSLYGPGKIAISLIPELNPGLRSEMISQVADEAFSELVQDPEGLLDKLKLGPSYIKAFLQSGANDTMEFLMMVKNGEIIF